MKWVITVFCMLAAMSLTQAQQNETELPFYLKDSGTGIPTSMFGTYIKQKETASGDPRDCIIKASLICINFSCGEDPGRAARERRINL